MAKIVELNGQKRVVREGLTGVFADLVELRDSIREDIAKHKKPCNMCYDSLDWVEHILFYMTVPLVEVTENGNTDAVYLDVPYPADDDDEENESEDEQAEADPVRCEFRKVQEI